MPIAFRCTRCRSRLHVPQRWQGTSVACPKCATRVMVPTESTDSPSGFERRDVEKSLEALEAVPGGIFSAATFELPEAGPHHSTATVPPDGRHRTAADSPSGTVPGRVTLPRWAIYASMVSYAVVAAIGFGLGWAAATGRWWR